MYSFIVSLIILSFTHRHFEHIIIFSEIPKENYDTLCILNYNTSSKLLEMTPSFSKSELKPYVIGLNNQDSRNSFYYWLIHVSSDISTNSLRKEMEIMAKVNISNFFFTRHIKLF